MRILYLSQYFPPEIGATQNRSYEMARQWVLLNHNVIMISEFPNHPSGIMSPEYHRRFIEKSTLDGIEVIRVWVKTSPNKNFRTRILFYLSYMVNAIIVGLFSVHGKIDFIYATSPPLFVGAAAILLSILKRIPMFFEVRDLWPESAIAIGELSNPSAISLATKLEGWCYQRAIGVVVVTQGVYRSLVQKGISPNKLLVIPNGSNTDLIEFNPLQRTRIRQKLGLENKFIAVYAGIHGLAQNLETVIEAARLLVNNKDIHFLFIGAGPKKDELINLGSTYKLNNLTFLTEKPRELIGTYLSAADVAIIPLRKAEIFESVIPSKLYDAWACKRPVLLSIEGEARELVEKVNGGRFVPPEDPAKMVDELLHLKNNPLLCEEMGEDGFEYTIKNHSRQTLATKLINNLEDML